MAQVLFHLRYTLNRRQRLVPHLRIWTPTAVILVATLFVFFLLEAYLSSIVFGFFAFLLLIVFRRMFRGILDVIFVPVRRMDVTFETGADGAVAAGILITSERWYLFLDGITDIQRLQKDTWTLQHFNGTVLHISALAITDDQIRFIRSVPERGRTPEGIKAVIERGKRIQEIMDRGQVR